MSQINDPFKSQGIVDPFQQQQPERYNALMDDTSVLDRILIGIGRGAVDVGQGISQLARHAGELIPGVDMGAEEYDRRIAEEAARFNRDAEGSIAAQGGRIGGNILATAVPAGAAGRVASVGGKALGLGRTGQAVAAGTAAGATEGGLLADTDGQSGIGDRLQQAAVGGALGFGGGLAVEGVRRGVQGVVNSPRAAAEVLTGGQGSGRGPIGRLGSAIRGNSRVRAQGERSQEILDINVLSEADLSGSSAGKMAENLRRQSYFTMDQAFLEDTKKQGAFLRRIGQMAKSLGRDGDNVTVAKQIQGATRNITDDIVRQRSEFGRKAYAQVDRFAQGRPVVDLRNSRAALQEMVEEFAAGGSDDAVQIAKKAAQRLKEIGDEPITATQAHNYLKQWSNAARGSGNLFSDIESSNSRRLAGKLANAAMQDLDEVATRNGGRLGDAIREANQGWRMHSQRIETVKNSVLGRVLGEEFADEVSGVAANRVSPEVVFKKMKDANPSELKVAMSYLDESAPEVAGNFRRSLIENALTVAKESPPSAGANPLPFNPAAFIRELKGGASGGRAVIGRKRLEAIFGDTSTWDELEAAFDIAERMADATGKNFSGTAAANQFYQLISTVVGNLADVTNKVGSSAASIIGLNTVGKYMQPGARSLPRFAVPETAITGNAARSVLDPRRYGAAAASGLAAGNFAPDVTERNRQNNR